MGAAWELEALKLRRSTAARVASLVVSLGAPGLSAGFTAVARTGGDSPMALKARAMLVGTGWEAYLGQVAQVLSVAVFGAVGVVVCWSFGREHTDGTFGSLFALPTSRRDIALAKFGALIAWGIPLCAATVVVSIALGPLAGLPQPDAGAVDGSLRVMVVGTLAVALTFPLAWVASVLRGYLPGITALLGIVVVTQIATVAGAGAWFPYAAPGLWAGLGGASAAADVELVQLMLPVPLAVLAVAATARWMDRADVR
jgi:ABC-2 type transport system permease protein